MNRLYIYFLALFLLGGCAAAAPVKPLSATVKVPFETVAKGVGGAWAEPGEAPRDEPLLLVMNNESEFSAFWNRLHRNWTPGPPLPPVDFIRNEVVAVVETVRPTGGYRVEVRDVQEGMYAIWFNVERTSPGAGCITAQSITQPYHVVTIARSGKRHVPQFFEVEHPCLAE